MTVTQFVAHTHGENNKATKGEERQTQQEYIHALLLITSQKKYFRFIFEHNIQYNTIHCVKHLITHLQQLADLNILLTIKETNPSLMQIVLNLANHLDTTRTKKRRSLNIVNVDTDNLNFKTANKFGQKHFSTISYIRSFLLVIQNVSCQCGACCSMLTIPSP